MLTMKLAGEPDVGNPQVRFDEGEQWNRASAPSTVLYSTASAGKCLKSDLVMILHTAMMDGSVITEGNRNGSLKNRSNSIVLCH